MTMTTDLALDPPGLHSPQHFPGGPEEWVYLQQTHRGTPVWICENRHCEKLTVAEQELDACPACGDSTNAVLHHGSYSPESVEEKFGTDDPGAGIDRATDRDGVLWRRNANPEVGGWFSGDEIMSWRRLLIERGPLRWDGA